MIKVMTYNIRHDLIDLFPKRKRINSWFKRKDCVVDIIKKHNADVICLQEVGRFFQRPYLKKHLKDYVYIESKHWFPLYPTNVTLVKKRLFILDVKRGSLSGGREPRTYIIVEVTHLEQNYIIANTHLDLDERVRQKHFDIIYCNTYKHDVPHNLQPPLIICGDLNMYKDHPLLSEIILRGFKSDTLSNGTFNHFKEEEPLKSMQIDYILHRGFKNSKSIVDISKYNDKFPSDHCPIISKLKTF